MKKMKIKSILLIVFTTIIVACSPYKNLTDMKSMKDMDYGYDVKYAELSSDINLAYIDEGAGSETIIFIHGLGSYLPAWKNNIDELSKSYRCIAIDLPGYGKSSKNPHSGLMTFYAKVVADFIDKLELSNVTLAGHSMGGQISMVAALHYPDKVKKLILVDPAGFEMFHPGQRLWFKDVMSPNLVRLTTVEAIENNLASNFYNMPKDALFMIEDRIAMRTADDFDNYCYAVSQSVTGMVDEPVLDKLKYIEQPTLIFFGENDNLIPNRYLNPGKTEPIAKAGANQIKNSKLIMVPKCGHFMMFEKPETFNAEVQNFLK
jgi:pimeloyl-ACP methyl ester carboxylesterase